MRRKRISILLVPGSTRSGSTNVAVLPAASDWLERVLRTRFSVNRPDSHLRRGPRESAEVIGLAAQRNACPGLLTQHRKNGGARRTKHLDPRGGLQGLRICSRCTFSNDLHMELH
jgi:hypothetical protein